MPLTFCLVWLTGGQRARLCVHQTRRRFMGTLNPSPAAIHPAPKILPLLTLAPLMNRRNTHPEHLTVVRSLQELDVLSSGCE